MATNQIPLQNALNPVYPISPKYCSSCGVNTVYKTLPLGDNTRWETVAVSPTMKHLYPNKTTPNYYPFQRITRPVGTLYEHDYSQFNSNSTTNGKSGIGKRTSYQYKVYPFTNRNVKEVSEYSDTMLPYMDWESWTKYPVIRDNSLNSHLHTFPNTYIPDRLMQYST